MFQPGELHIDTTDDELKRAFLIATAAIEQANIPESVRIEAINLIHDTLLAHAACHLVLRDWQANKRLSVTTVGALKQATKKSLAVQKHLLKPDRG